MSFKSFGYWVGAFPSLQTPKRWSSGVLGNSVGVALCSRLFQSFYHVRVTAPLVEDEGYWQKCCKAKWDICDTSKHGNNWKRMFFEKTVEG
jgi:hypothetical protein